MDTETCTSEDPGQCPPQTDSKSATHAKLQSCLEMLRKSKSDNHKFAALMTVTQLKNDELTFDDFRELYDAIGAKFLTRMLKSKSVPEGCPEHMYKSVALSIMSVLSTDPYIAQRIATKKNLDTLQELIQLNPRDDDVDKNIVNDSYDVLTYICSTVEGMHMLAENSTVTYLTDAVTEDLYGSDKALNILCAMIIRLGSKVWEQEQDFVTFHRLMGYYVKLFEQYQDKKKFDLCGLISLFLSSVSDSMKESCMKNSWLLLLVKNIQQILTSKLGSEQREPTLMLAASLIQRLGVACLVPPIGQDIRLYMIITNLSCIEVRMILENLPLDEIIQKANVLGSCYQLLEDIISHMTTDNSPPTDGSQTLQLHSALTGAFNAILSFLKEMSLTDTENPPPIVIATVRVLGAWLAEETSALRIETYEILPYLLHLCSLQVKAISMSWSCEKRKLDAHGAKIQSQLNAPEISSSRQSLKCDHHKSTGDMDVDDIARGVSECEITCSSDVSTNQIIQNTEKLNGQTSKTEIEENSIKTNGFSEEKETKIQSESHKNVKGKKNVETNTSTELCSRETNISKNKTVTFSEEFQEQTENSEITNKHLVSKDTKVQSDSASLDSAGNVWLMGDFVRFLLPGLCHLTAEDKSRQIILSSTAQSWLVDYFNQCIYKVLTQKEADQEKINGSLAVLCGILLNVIVMETDLVTNDEHFLYLCSVIIDTVPLLENREDCIILWANMVTLGLFLVRNQVNLFTDTRESLVQFFKSSLSLVKAPFVSKKQGQTDVMVIKGEFLSVWDDVYELWHLSAQVLFESIPLYPEELPCLFLSTGLLEHIMALLLLVKGGPAPQGVCNNFLSLITEVCKFSCEARDQAKAAGALKVAGIFKHDALSEVLK